MYVYKCTYGPAIDLSPTLKKIYIYTHTHIYTHTYIYICMYVCI